GRIWSKVERFQLLRAAASKLPAMPSATPTPTPLPNRRAEEVTEPNAQPGATTMDEARRGLARSPAQWEAEALAMVEEADARTGVAAGALRYASARMFEDGVGDLAAAM